MITVPKLLILLVIVAVIFGTKKLRNVGTDLGEAIRNFKFALKEGEDDLKPKEDVKLKEDVIEGQVNTDKTDET